MPYTPAQIRLFEARAHGAGGSGGPSAAQAQKMLAEVGGKATRRDVDKTGHAKPKKLKRYRGHHA